jgi:hypothetical protein
MLSHVERNAALAAELKIYRTLNLFQFSLPPLAGLTCEYQKAFETQYVQCCSAHEYQSG